MTIDGQLGSIKGQLGSINGPVNGCLIMSGEAFSTTREGADWEF